MRVTCVLGTRPEIVKLAPLISAMRRGPGMTITVIDSGQQPAVFASTAEAFNLKIDIGLGIHRAGRNLAQLTAALLPAIHNALKENRPDLVVVQGDTQTALTGAVAASLLHIPVAHVEAGLRSGDISAPYPEEINRRLIADIAELHFAPSLAARDNLRREGILDDAIAITGNTIVDSLIGISRAAPASQRSAGAKRMLITAHRRENWDHAIHDICAAVAHLSAECPDYVTIFILPLAPKPRLVIEQTLTNKPRIVLLEPLPYPDFLQHLAAADLVISDSGGILEEAVSLGIPTVVARNVLDRPEALTVPWVRLAGTQETSIINTAMKMMRMPRVDADPRSGPFGDGKAATRIVTAIERWRQGRRPLLSADDEFHPPLNQKVEHV